VTKSVMHISNTSDLTINEMDIYEQVEMKFS
jgi:hypothetical protein